MSEEPITRTIAIYIDLENVAIGVRDARMKTFDIDLVLKRLLDKGNIVVRKAYADWGRYEDYKRPLHSAGVELIDLPGSKITGKNSADIKMVVDALELSYTKPHINCFALVTGDSDFYPLVAKLRENDKHTIAIGVKNSTSPLLIDSCDEFIFYDDLVRRPRPKKKGKMTGLPPKTREAFALLLEAAEALQREDKQLYSSLVKETMKRKQPQFSEEYHGYRSFSRLLEDAQRHKLISISKSERSGTYVIDEITEDDAA
ncbi:MAG: NYN domain-containing protein [Deltaproteobacteria bacterium]|nr:NYN domain-containing protein [Deltaproteobacteria bacterium]MBW2413303.1 NYN domain-containing protein [Deltaproteobacteria bacterium]